MRWYLTPAAVLLTACATTAGVPTLNDLDADRDGKISRHEAAESYQVNAMFVSADTNRDSFLDNTEFERAREAIRERNRELDRELSRNEGGDHQPPPGAKRQH